MAIGDELSDLPPSAKLVYKALEYNGGMTQAEIVEETKLPQRTVRLALKRLDEIDDVTKEIYIPDARQSLYTLTVEAKQSVDADPDSCHSK